MNDFKHYNECPRCNHHTGVTRENCFLTPTNEPCADMALCIQNLRKQLENLEFRLSDRLQDIESRLEHHNL
jgi:ribosomal protein S14